MTETHPSNLTMIEGAVFSGGYEGAYRVMTAADWLSRYAHDKKAAIAIRRARDGVDGVVFNDAYGIIWNLRRA